MVERGLREREEGQLQPSQALLIGPGEQQSLVLSRGLIWGTQVLGVYSSLDFTQATFICGQWGMPFGVCAFRRWET